MIIPKTKKPESFLREENFKMYGTHYCPGCGHGLISKIIGEVMDEYKIRERTIFVASVGCSVFDYEFFSCDSIQAPHGRAPAIATGIKRARPDTIILLKQGDGDLIAIGTNEIIHAANRGENISVFFVNNAIYGMTGGQMAPTTLPGQKTTTTPSGRSVETGYPLPICEILNQLHNPIYLERTALYDIHTIRNAKNAIKKSIRIQIENKGFSLVEILSPCPTGWKMNVEDSLKYIKEEMTKYFPLKLFRDLE